MPVILIAATLDLDPARRDQALRDAQVAINATLSEPGCTAYTWSLDAMDPGRVHVFEEWTDEESLAHHFAGQPYQSMRAFLQAGGVTRSVSAKYRVDAISAVYNAEGKAIAGFPDA
jgi:quinol monooxygenase YgiN